MICSSEIPFLPAIILGAVLGLVAYFASASFRPAQHKLDVAPAMESGACGAGVVAGLHLAYGAICPALIVHLVDPNGNGIKMTDLFLRVGNQFQPANPVLQMGEFHTLHILLGGIATVLVAGIALVRFCRGS